MFQDTDWAYLAGIIDGEGCINITCSTGGAYVLQLRISQKNKEDLTKLQSIFSGSFNPNRNTASYQLYWGGHEAESVLRKCFPYLKWKKDEAETAIAFACECMLGKGRKQDRKLAQFSKEVLHEIKEAKYASRF